MEIACLEITDHSGCVEDHADPAFRCQREAYPYGDWAAVGLYAEDAANVVLKHLNIHGLAHAGIWAGRLTNWTRGKCPAGGNGWVGWDGDIEGSTPTPAPCPFAMDGGVERLRRDLSRPAADRLLEPDGRGLRRRGRHREHRGHWIIEDSIFHYNTPDGLDLLYAREPGSQIDIRRTLAAGQRRQSDQDQRASDHRKFDHRRKLRLFRRKALHLPQRHRI